MSDTACQLFADDKLTLVQEREKVASSQHLHHNIDRILILEHIVEFYYVRVLADFENFNFSLEQLQVFDGQIFLLNDLHGTFLASFLMATSFY